MQLIHQLFRRKPAQKSRYALPPKRPLPVRKPADEADELFAKLAAVPWIRKTHVEL